MQALLSADELPGLNDRFAWSPGRTSRAEPRRLAGTCHRFGMLAIGADQLAFRSYRPPAGANATASEMVADFPDPKTAWRAYQTLLGWRKACPGQLKSYPRTDVGLPEGVSLDRGEAVWWLLKYGPIGDDPDVAAFDAEGVAMVGSRIAVVHMVVYGQDYNYPPGQEPIIDAVRSAAARLG
ncbi:hypothetical protein BH18ACT9_BH18ACT9_21520 [soil metagenome]